MRDDELSEGEDVQAGDMTASSNKYGWIWNPLP